MLFKRWRESNVLGHPREELVEIQSPPLSVRTILGLALGAIVFGITVGVLVAGFMR